VNSAEHGFGGPPKPTGQRPVLPMATDSKIDSVKSGPWWVTWESARQIGVVAQGHAAALRQL